MKKFFIVTIIIVVAGVAVYFGFSKKKLAVESGSETYGDSAVGEATAGSSTIWEPDAVFQEPIVYDSLRESYSHANFSFKHSDGFRVASNIVEGGEVITIENPKGSGFQVFISVFDESGPITPERIWQDQPDMEINDPKNADLDGAKTLVFYGYDEDLGETFEAWTIRKGKLYQITGPKTAERLIIKTLETWSWK